MTFNYVQEHAFVPSFELTDYTQNLYIESTDNVSFASSFIVGSPQNDVFTVNKSIILTGP